MNALDFLAGLVCGAFSAAVGFGALGLYLKAFGVKQEDRSPR